MKRDSFIRINSSFSYKYRIIGCTLFCNEQPQSAPGARSCSRLCGPPVLSWPDRPCRQLCWFRFGPRLTGRLARLAPHLLTLHWLKHMATRKVNSGDVSALTQGHSKVTWQGKARGNRSTNPGARPPLQSCPRTEPLSPLGGEIHRHRHHLCAYKRSHVLICNDSCHWSSRVGNLGCL